jgi:hypothetical protein
MAQPPVVLVYSGARARGRAVGTLSGWAREDRGVIVNTADGRCEKEQVAPGLGGVEPAAPGCCGDEAPWDSEATCDGFEPAPPPEALSAGNTYTGHVTLYLWVHEPFEAAEEERGDGHDPDVP